MEQVCYGRAAGDDRPAVFGVSPFLEMGAAGSVLRHFGGDPRRFRATMAELQRRLHADAA